MDGGGRQGREGTGSETPRPRRGRMGWDRQDLLIPHQRGKGSGKGGMKLRAGLACF